MKVEQSIRNIEEELSTLDAMVVALAELLDRKGLITHSEWDEEVRRLLAVEGRLTQLRNRTRK